jgi:stage V sporulation protein B
MITSSIIALVVNVIFMISIILLSPFISLVILKNEATQLSIIALGLLVPLISLGGLIKGYYAGIGKVEITAYSQISEEIARIIFVILFSSFFISKGNAYLAYGAFLSLCAGEIFSLTHMILSLPNFKSKPLTFFKNVKKKENYITKDILEMSIPLTSGKLISVIAYTLEPIIMTNIMLKMGLTSNYITNEYGIISGYAFPLLLMPGFFASAFGRVLLHPLTSLISKNDKKQAKKLLSTITFASLLIGFISSFIMFFFSKELMVLLYKNSLGWQYVKTFSFPFLLYYIESPLISAMTAINRTKTIMIYDTISSILRILLLFILIPKLEMMGVALATVISSSSLVILMSFDIKRYFRKNQ